MKYVSTRDTSKTFEFKDVFIKGLADDGGLFIPEKLAKYVLSLESTILKKVFIMPSDHYKVFWS